jgi:hypothetical protein
MSIMGGNGKDKPEGPTAVMIGQIVVLPDGNIAAGLVEGLEDPLLVAQKAAVALLNGAINVRLHEVQDDAAKKIVRPRPVIYRP